MASMNARTAAATAILDFPVRRGSLFAGKYEVDRVLASGGMGMIIRARHMALDQMVAIKCLLPGAGTRDALARFEREARAAAKIKGDHVARVIDLGTLENGAPYIVMEYLVGEDLDERVKRRGPLPVHEAVDFITQGCVAIAEAHGLGIIHRDLKSSNLFVVTCPDGSERIKVLDFGIAKVAGAGLAPADKAKTATFAVMGSPYYMSPEQLRSTRDVDETTDIWALGVILYELLSGRMPFEGTTMPDLWTAITSGEPAPITRSAVPDGLQAVIHRCLAKSRDKRYRSAAELARALAPFGSKMAAETAQRAWKITQIAKDASQKRTTKRPALRPRMTAALIGAAALLGLASMQMCGETHSTAARDAPAHGVPAPPLEPAEPPSR